MPLMVDPLLSLPSRRLSNNNNLHGTYPSPTTHTQRPVLTGSGSFLVASPMGSTSYRSNKTKSNLGVHKIAKTNIDSSIEKFNLNLKTPPATPPSPSLNFIPSSIEDSNNHTTNSNDNSNSNNDNNNKKQMSVTQTTSSASTRSRSRSRSRSHSRSHSCSGSPPRDPMFANVSPRERSTSNPTTITKTALNQIIEMSDVLSENAEINEGPKDKTLSTPMQDETLLSRLLPQSILPTIPPPTPNNATENQIHSLDNKITNEKDLGNSESNTFKDTSNSRGIPQPPTMPPKTSSYNKNLSGTKERAKSITQIMAKKSSLIISQAARALYLHNELPPSKDVVVTGLEKGWVSQRVNQLNQMWRKSQTGTSLPSFSPKAFEFLPPFPPSIIHPS